MDYQLIEEKLKSGYREIAERYRRDDEIEVATPNHRRVAGRLQTLCVSFAHPIRALDAGCGTGRFFHSLINVEELVGLDISKEMLQAAQGPVRQEQISIRKIRLVCGNVYLASFPPESFHLIYSLGMFGNGCPVTPELCNRFHEWLAPGGKLLFNVMDVAGLPLRYRARRRARNWIYPKLATQWRRLLDKRAARRPFFDLTRSELEEILRRTKFMEFEITSHLCESPLWDGRHLECVATK